jgi:putative ABC transport system permease protein
VTGYYIRLALQSFRRHPGLTAVMVCAIALGIGVCIVTMTVYHAVSGNPIWWKNDRLYAITVDTPRMRSPDQAHPTPDQPTLLLAYEDASHLFASPIPERRVMMVRGRATIAGGARSARPMLVPTRETTADFFAMFDVPFLYGGAWDARADARPEPVIVLSRDLNDTLFGGANSVGRMVSWNEHEFRVVGVLDAWFPKPKFYDLNQGGAYDPPEDAFIPFAWGPLLQQHPFASECFSKYDTSSFAGFLHSDCLWVQMWVELPGEERHQRMQTMLDAYWIAQRAHGRFPTLGAVHLTRVSEWLTENDIVESDDRIMVVAAFAFLAVCLANTLGILLARFLSRAPSTGVRRALGATRRDVLAQHLLEVGAISLCGAALGLLLGAAGLHALHALYAIPGVRSGYQELMRFDAVSIAWAVALAVGSALVAGLYPSWRAGRLPPAVYLKSQ